MKETAVWLIWLMVSLGLVGSLPCRAQGEKVLNNFVTELLHVSPPADRRSHQYRFVHPRDGWLLLRTTAQVGARGRVVLRLDGSEVAVHEPTSPSTLENFRWLRAGKHELRAEGEGDGRLERLIVRLHRLE